MNYLLFMGDKMGQAKLRGTFEERKAQAIAAGRIPEIRRKTQREARAARRAAINAHLEFLRKLQEQAIQRAAKNR